MTTAQTPPQLTVRCAAERWAPVVDVLSAAFRTDTLFRWMIPDSARRAEVNPPLSRILFDSHFPSAGSTRPGSR